MRFPIHIELRRSRLLFGLMFSMHAVAGGCLLLLPWPPTPRLLLLMMIAWSAWRSLRRSRVRGLRLAGNGDLDFLLASGEMISAAVQPDTAVFSRMIVLRLRSCDSGRLLSLTLLSDSMPAMQFRLLRLWLRWRAEPSDRFAGGV